MEKDYHTNFVDTMNKLIVSTQNTPYPIRPLEKSFSLADLGVIITQIEKEEKEKEVEKKLRERWWEEEKKEEKKKSDLYPDEGVYIRYMKRQVYTYQKVGSSRIIVSIRSRPNSACARCGAVDAKLRKGWCKECDISMLPYQKNEI